MPGTATGRKCENGFNYFEVCLSKQDATDADPHAVIHALIDNGANVSIISLELAEQLGLEITDKVLPYTGVGTSDFGSIGTANATIILKDDGTGATVQINQEVAIRPSMVQPMIMGLDLLAHFEINIPKGGIVTAAWK